MLPPDDETQPEEPTETEEAPNDAETSEEEKPAQATEDAEAEAQEGEGDEVEEAPDAEAKEGEEKPAAETEPEAKRKRAGGWQRRIERQDRQIQILTEQLARQGQPPTPAAKPDKDKTADEKAAEYIDSLVEKRLEARETQQRQKAVVADWLRRTDEVRAAHDDFDDVVPSVNIPTGSGLGQALLTSEHGPAIMYALAKSPAELARISALPPLDAAREIGRLEAKLSSSTPPVKATATARRPAAPPTSVRGSTSNTRSLEDLDISQYKRAYRAGRR